MQIHIIYSKWFEPTLSHIIYLWLATSFLVSVTKAIHCLEIIFSLHAAVLWENSKHTGRKCSFENVFQSFCFLRIRTCFFKYALLQNKHLSWSFSFWLNSYLVLLFLVSVKFALKLSRFTVSDNLCSLSLWTGEGVDINFSNRESKNDITYNLIY